MFIHLQRPGDIGRRPNAGHGNDDPGQIHGQGAEGLIVERKGTARELGTLRRWATSW